MTGFLILLAIVAYGIGYQVTEIDPVKLITSLSKSQKILTALIHPDLVTHETTDTTLDIVFPVPCGSAQPTKLPGNGPRIVPSVECANPRDLITLQGFNMAPNNDVKLSWLLPNGGVLFSKWATTDANGSFTTEVEVRPINATTDGIPSHLQAETAVPMGPLIPSTALKDVIHDIVVTIFMALLATTAGTIIAVPISFLAARNIMGRNCIGTTIYTVVRGIFKSHPLLRFPGACGCFCLVGGLWSLRRGAGPDDSHDRLFGQTFLRSSREHRPGSDRGGGSHGSKPGGSGPFCSRSPNHP